ncbi:hypothetical protein [Pseudoalteromonas shioyasakiensis]|uniref:hypothetical protein n=1 Tax=Pseudoalteromonas shioyasakiensis TaxID=1190813 RepID=UPI000782FA19|nr:hypothetical protein [Pseudoalteromonas shioyasakiensis]
MHLEYKKHSFYAGAGVLFFFLFYYPFVFRYFSDSFYKGLMLSISILISIFALDAFSRRRIHNSSVFSLLAVSLSVSKIIFLLLSSLLIHQEFDFVPEVIRVIIVVYLILFFEPYSWIKYEKVIRSIIVVLTSLALVGFFLTLFVGDVRLTEIQISTSGDLDEGVRGVSLFGLQWMRLPYLGEYVYRIQSFTSEAGNFAMALGPVVIYYLTRSKLSARDYFILLIILTALLLTLSLSAFASLIIVYLVILKRTNKNLVRPIFIFFTISLLLYFALDNYFITEYLKTKFVSSDVGSSSLAQRQEQIESIKLVAKNCLYVGCGVNTASSFNLTIAIGWLVTLINYGLVYMFLFVIFLLYILKGSLKESKQSETILLSAMCLVFFIAQGFFRGEPISSPWYWFYLLPLLELKKFIKFERGCNG